MQKALTICRRMGRLAMLSAGDYFGIVLSMWKDEHLVSRNTLGLRVMRNTRILKALATTVDTKNPA